MKRLQYDYVGTLMYQAMMIMFERGRTFDEDERQNYGFRLREHLKEEAVAK